LEKQSGNTGKALRQPDITVARQSVFLPFVLCLKQAGNSRGCKAQGPGQFKSRDYITKKIPTSFRYCLLLTYQNSRLFSCSGVKKTFFH